MPRSLGTLEGRTFAAVLFDMDGTLIDSIPVVIRSLAAVGAGGRRRPARPRRLPRRARRGESSGAAARRSGWTRAFERIEAIEIADTEGITVLPGTLDALAVLTGDVERCAIATSCTRPLADARLARHRAAGAAGGRHRERRRPGQAAPRPVPARRGAARASTRPTASSSRTPRVVSRPARAAGCSTLAVTTTTAAADLVADAVVRQPGRRAVLGGGGSRSRDAGGYRPVGWGHGR